MPALIILAMLMPSAVIAAQDVCDYQAVKGSEFVFATRTEGLQKFGYQLWSTTPEPGGSLPYNEYVGKKGKFTGEKSTSPHNSVYFWDVMMSDCSKLFLMLSKANLADEIIEFYGAQWLQEPSQNWHSEIRVDAITNERTCIVAPKAPMPYPHFVYSNGGKSVSAAVVGGDFPGMDVAFRVDRLTAIMEKEGLSGTNANRIIQQVRAGGKHLLVRSYAWPNDVPDTKEFSLKGMVAALDQCKARVRAH